MHLRKCSYYIYVCVCVCVCVCMCVSYKDESKEKKRKGFKEKFGVKKNQWRGYKDTVRLRQLAWEA